MGENTVIEIWCDGCNLKFVSQDRHRDHNDREILRRKLMDKGWAVSQSYDSFAYCPECAKSRREDGWLKK